MKENHRTVTVFGADRAPGSRMPALSTLLTPALVIEKNVPLPTDRVRGVRCAARERMDAMEPGDSLLVPTSLHSASAVRLMVRSVRKDFPDRQFTTRTREGGIRVWRTE
jgi:hypothetical protein